ncbi:DUF6090 family protein, partial [Algoriphagus sp. SE2]|uniref:DUF6090 family protein n=1 Tax=Algoriphagus sp. SE2 TaxID=3141536 RepID=UPI0031CD0453
MLSEGKTGKYFKYAIGEIVLVMIGILLALQVNNWNENRKLKIQEKILLEGLKESIAGDLRSLPKWQKYSSATPNSVNVILYSFEQNLAYQDSLNYHFGNTSMPWNPSISNELFESLNSSDLNLISNVELRREIILYYNHAKQMYVYQNKYNAIIERASENIFRTRFNSLWDGITVKDVPMIPNDYESLKNDVQYLYFLKSLRNQFQLYIGQPTNYAILKAEKLLTKIENELSK